MCVLTAADAVTSTGPPPWRALPLTGRALVSRSRYERITSNDRVACGETGRPSVTCLMGGRRCVAYCLFFRVPQSRHPSEIRWSHRGSLRWSLRVFSLQGVSGWRLAGVACCLSMVSCEFRVASSFLFFASGGWCSTVAQRSRRLWYRSGPCNDACALGGGICCKYSSTLGYTLL